MGTTTNEHTGSAEDVDDIPTAMPGGSSSLRVSDEKTTWLAASSLLSVLAFAMALVALVVAFTIDDGGGGGGGGTDTPVVPTADLAIDAKEYSFDPARAAVPADTDVTLTVNNGGSLDHNWTVLSSSINEESDFDEALVVAGSGDVASGATSETTFNLPAGEYQVICTISGHFTQGMRGTLTVS